MVAFWIVAAIAVGIGVPLAGIIFGLMEPEEDEGW